MEKWLVFRDDTTGRELCAYTIRGTFEGEAEATAEMLAAENGLQVDQISATVESR